MAGFGLEGTVVGPEVHGVCDTCDASLVHLFKSAAFILQLRDAYHLRSLGASYRKFQVRIFLPVSKEQRELSEEAVVDIS